MTTKASIALWVGLVACLATAGIPDEVSDGPIVPGVWNSNFKAAKTFADMHGAPMFVFLGQRSCSLATAYTRALEEDVFKHWVAEHAIVLVYKRATPDEFSAMFETSAEDSAYPDFWETRAWLKSVNRNLRTYPFAGIYWPTPSNVVSVAYTAKSDSLPGVVGRSGSLAERTVALLNLYCGSAPKTIPGVDGPSEPTSNLGEKNLEYSLAIYKEGFVVGTVSLTAKKATPAGNVALKGTLLTPDGKKRSFSKTVWYLNPDVEITFKGYGTLSLTFGVDEVSGSIDGNPVLMPESVGGSMAASTMPFMIAGDFPIEIAGVAVVGEALPNGEPVNTQSARWSLTKSGGVKWRPSSRVLQVAESNPSSLKLSYARKTGLFSGTFYVYTAKYKYNADGVATGCTLKKYSANVGGLVVDGEGWGEATIKGVGSWPVRVTVGEGND